jgi:hypothetical protein
MDVSKLPRLSKTDQPPPPFGASPTVGDDYPHARPAAPERVVYVVQDPRPAGAEAWISGAIGALLLLFYPRLIQWVLHKVAGTAFTWTFTDENGAPLEYPQTIFIWGDLVVTLFAIVLLIDAVVLLWGRSRALVAGAMALTILVTAANLVYVVATFAKYNLAVMSAIAVAYGGFIAIHQWRLLKSLRAGQPL